MTKDAQPHTGRQHMPMIEARGLTLQRGVIDVIRRLSLDVIAGTALIIHGANGSGKTTLLRGLAGLLMPVDGTISINGTLIDQDRMAVMSSMIYIGHRDGGSGHLTAGENLKFWADTCGSGMSSTRVAIQHALADFGMEAHVDTPLYMMSEGQRKRCGLARLTLAARSDTDKNNGTDRGNGANDHLGKIWLLDEPLTALDTVSADAVVQAINRFTKSGGTAVVATHQDMALAAVKVMHLGKDSPL